MSHLTFIFCNTWIIEVVNIKSKPPNGSIGLDGVLDSFIRKALDV